jgi:hypothetical protein
MKYVCLGYFDEKAWEKLPDSERNEFMDRCLEYDETLKQKGHVAGGEALQSASNGATVQLKNGKISVTDGPYIETKEQLGGILMLEAKDLDEAIRLISNHPGINAGPFEIRPVEDMSAMIAESERRRSAKKK